MEANKEELLLQDIMNSLRSGRITAIEAAKKANPDLTDSEAHDLWLLAQIAHANLRIRVLERELEALHNT